MNERTSDITPATRSNNSPSLDDIAASMLVQPSEGSGPSDDAAPADGVSAVSKGRRADKQKRKARRNPEVTAQEIEDGEAEDTILDTSEEREEADLQRNVEADDATLTGAPDEDDDVDEGANSGDPLEASDEDVGDEDDDPLFSDIFSADADQERVSDDTETTQIDPSKLGDDIVLSVTVDGEDQQVSLGELKKRYAGEGAIESRLQAATEARNHTHEQFQQTRQFTEMVLNELGQNLFRRAVPKPDESLLDTDPAAYMRQKELYDAEGQAIGQSHKKLYTMMQELNSRQEEVKKQERAAAAKELRRMMPVLSHPKNGPKVRKAIVQAARDIGFSDAEIAECTNPRIFKAVALAARELNRNRRVTVKKDIPSSRTTEGTRGRNRKPQTAQERTEKATFKRARETGTVDDVAATMLQAPPKRGRRR